MAEYRYYLIPDAMTRAFPEQFGKQTPTEFFDNIADLEKRYHQLREMPYNNERTWNERTRFPYARLVVGIDRQNPDGAVAIIQVRNGVNYLCDDYRGPYADRSDAQIPQMAKKLVEVIGVDRVRPHTYTQRDGYTWVQVEKDMHITEWLYAHELCSSLQFTRFLNRDGRELFQVRDGQRVIETNADGTKRLRAVKNIDVTSRMSLKSQSRISPTSPKSILATPLPRTSSIRFRSMRIWSIARSASLWTIPSMRRIHTLRWKI